MTEQLISEDEIRKLYERSNQEQLKVAEERALDRNSARQIVALNNLVSQLLEIVVQEKAEQAKYRHEQDLMRNVLFKLAEDNEGLKLAFSFRTPEKLEAALLKKAQNLTEDEHAALIWRVRNADFSKIKPAVKKKKAGK